MRKQVCSSALLLLICVPFIFRLSTVDAGTCKPSGEIRGKKPPPAKCNKENNSDCCDEGKYYATYKCSPTVSHHTKATLTFNSFEDGGVGRATSECDNK